jgi:hypothetical protein
MRHCKKPQITAKQKRQAKVDCLSETFLFESTVFSFRPHRTPKLLLVFLGKRNKKHDETTSRYAAWRGVDFRRRISPRIRTYMQNRFSPWIRGPPGVQFNEKNRGSKIYWDCPFKYLFTHMAIRFFFLSTRFRRPIRYSCPVSWLLIVFFFLSTLNKEQWAMKILSWLGRILSSTKSTGCVCRMLFDISAHLFIVSNNLLTTTLPPHLGWSRNYESS